MTVCAEPVFLQRLGIVEGDQINLFGYLLLRTVDGGFLHLLTGYECFFLIHFQYSREEESACK